MDLYDLSFFLSTMWIGPFWIAMMIYPEHEKTHQLMQGPWFFIGPILIWYLVSFSDVSGLIGLAKDSMNPSNALQGLADLLGTKAGASAAAGYGHELTIASDAERAYFKEATAGVSTDVVEKVTAKGADGAAALAYFIEQVGIESGN